MIKKRFPILLSVCFIILCVGLPGCTSRTDKVDTSPSPADIVQTEVNNSPSQDSRDTIDYSQYLKKIWVVENWHGGAYGYFSFFITEIADGVVEGKFNMRSLAEPDFYFYSFDSWKLGDMSGFINNNMAECQFNKDGNKGNVTLIFKENDRIEATIEYTDKEQQYEEMSLDGNFLFRPYNLSDTRDHFVKDEEYSFTADLNSWGSVNFVSGSSPGNKPHPEAYLTNDHDDILYVFGASFKTGTEITEASIQDMNDDGLKDVMIITEFRDPGIEPIEWIFYQMDDGLFYSP